MRVCSAHTAELPSALLRRNMRGDEARRLCPEMRLVQVPTAHGKADLTLYRDWSVKVPLSPVVFSSKVGHPA